MWWYSHSPTNHRQNPYRGRVQDLTYQSMPVMEITSINISLDCCQTKQQDIYPPFLHIRCIAVDLFFMYHVWLLSNIAGNTKAHLTDSRFGVLLKSSWLTVFKTQNWVYAKVRMKAEASFSYCNAVSANVHWTLWKQLLSQQLLLDHNILKTFKDWQFNGTRVRELDQNLATW